MLDRELLLTRKLYEQKVVPEIEMLRLDRQATEMSGQLAEAQSKIANTLASFRSQADEDLAKSKGDLAVLDENIKSAQDRVRRTDLRAPVHGIVNKLNVTTIGAVVQPGANLMDIIPLDDSLLVEGRIRPQDIAFIRPAQDAVVKLSAYDFSVYGSLKGKVERISADTIVDEKADKSERQETFYRVMVRTDKNHLGTDREAASDHPRHGGDGGNSHRREIRSRLPAQARTHACGTRPCASAEASVVWLIGSQFRFLKFERSDEPPVDRLLRIPRLPDAV